MKVCLSLPSVEPLSKFNSGDLSYNEIRYLPGSCCNDHLQALFLQNNQINSISNKTFTTLIKYQFLSANRLKNIPYRAFDYTGLMWGKPVIMLSDNPLETIEPEAFRAGSGHLSVFLLRTNLKILSLESFIGPGMVSTL
ncbi:hypothetical protein ACROYT_G014806 [Oculina patagonica]